MDAGDPDFEDSDPEEVEEFLRRLGETQAQVIAAAQQLIEGGCRAALVPLEVEDVVTYAIVGTEVELKQVFATAESTLASIEVGKHLAAARRDLLEPVALALLVAGSASGMCLPLPASGLYLAAGDLESVEYLVQGLGDA